MNNDNIDLHLALQETIRLMNNLIKLLETIQKETEELSL